MKEKFFKSVTILLVGGLLTKVLGMLIKIIMSRLIGTEGLGLYMMGLTNIFTIYWNWSIWSTNGSIKTSSRKKKK